MLLHIAVTYWLLDSDLKVTPLNYNLHRDDFCQTLTIGCLSYRNTNFEIRKGDPRDLLGVPSRYSYNSYNIITVLFMSAC